MTLQKGELRTEKEGSQTYMSRSQDTALDVSNQCGTLFDDAVGAIATASEGHVKSFIDIFVCRYFSPGGGRTV